MAPFYEVVCTGLRWTADAALLERMRSANATELARLDAAVLDAQTNQGESELREALLARATHFAQIGDKERALSALRGTSEKTVAVGQKLDLLFTQIRLGLFYRDHELVTRGLERARADIEAGGDWDRRNRLKVYEGVHAMATRQLARAATLFLDTLATFTCTELFSYSQFIFYTVLLAALALERVPLKQKVMVAPEVLASIDDVPHARDYLNALYNSSYADFFAALAALQARARLDQFFAPHAAFYVREMRVRAYAQLLQSYRSLQLSSMAAAFRVSEPFLDRELARFIAAGRLHCHIDKVRGIVHTTRPDSRNHLYATTIKDGDLLLNRIQKLSRVINI